MSTFGTSSMSPAVQLACKDKNLNTGVPAVISFCTQIMQTVECRMAGKFPPVMIPIIKPWAYICPKSFSGGINFGRTYSRYFTKHFLCIHAVKTKELSNSKQEPPSVQYHINAKVGKCGMEYQFVNLNIII